ncbi:MAG: hypothetical protein IPK88_18405 [Saprospiraceae bacterium]|nr:hypothetical protein [Candidatus Defluviibacterium haderslevense]
MNKLNHDLIVKLAKEYILVNKDLKNSNLSQYPLRVFMDDTHPDRLVVVKEMELSTLESLDLSKIEEYFFNQCDFEKEYLVLVVYGGEGSNLDIFILGDYPDKSGIN